MVKPVPMDVSSPSSPASGDRSRRDRDSPTMQSKLPVSRAINAIPRSENDKGFPASAAMRDT